MSRVLCREVGLKHRAEVQLQLPTAGAPRPNTTRVTLHQESVLISDVKTEKGTQYYQVSWCDKRGRSHVVSRSQCIPVQPNEIDATCVKLRQFLQLELLDGVSSSSNA